MGFACFKCGQIHACFVLFLVCLFIFSPLLNIVFQGLSATQLFGYWQNPQLWKALAYSLTTCKIDCRILSLFGFLIVTLPAIRN